MHDMRKLIMIAEGRDPSIEYTEKKVKGVLDRVTATLSGKQSAAFTRLGKKYEEIDTIEKELSAQKEQLNAEAKEKMEALFDIEDEVYTRVVETASLVLTLSKRTEDQPAPQEQAIETDVEGMLAELLEMMPDLTDTLNTLRNKYTKEVTRTVMKPAAGKKGAPPRLGKPKFKTEESATISEGISDWIAKFKNWASKKLNRFDSKFDQLKAKAESL